MHTISLLATLNARKMIRQRLTQQTDNATDRTSPLVFRDFGTCDTTKVLIYFTLNDLRTDSLQTQRRDISIRLSSHRRSKNSNVLRRTITQNADMYELQQISTANFHSTVCTFTFRTIMVGWFSAGCGIYLRREYRNTCVAMQCAF